MASETLRVPTDPVRAGCASGSTGSYLVTYADGTEERIASDVPAFTMAVRDRQHLERVLAADAYTAALWFVRGDFDVSGDLVAAARLQRGTRRRDWRALLHAFAAHLAPGRIGTWLQTRRRAAQNIRQHYDRAAEFYRQFLDRRMVYSCAYFRTPDVSLDDAQLAKLEHICCKLDLRSGERFLDVGCGWGALLVHAAQRYAVDATGCTLSGRQAAHARMAASDAGPNAKISVHEADFQDIEGHFDKIASVGMFEHVGRHRLRHYLRTVHRLLDVGGLFLNHGIVRPAFVSDDSETLFLQRRVFPGGELVHLADVIQAAELEGFEVLDVEDLRRHYALTCRAWVGRLQQNSVACLQAVDRTTYRTWLVYLAASAESFDRGATSVYQVLLARRGSPRSHLTRDYMYGQRTT